VAKIRESLNDQARRRARALAGARPAAAAAEVVACGPQSRQYRLSEKDRQRMVEIVKASKGRPSNISDRQRKELKALLTSRASGTAKTVATSGLAGGHKGTASQSKSGRPVARRPLGCRAVKSCEGAPQEPRLMR